MNLERLVEQQGAYAKTVARAMNLKIDASSRPREISDSPREKNASKRRFLQSLTTPLSQIAARL
jgi:hypothetical protein